MNSKLSDSRITCASISRRKMALSRICRTPLWAEEHKVLAGQIAETDGLSAGKRWSAGITQWICWRTGRNMDVGSADRIEDQRQICIKRQALPRHRRHSSGSVES